MIALDAHMCSHDAYGPGTRAHRGEGGRPPRDHRHRRRRGARGRGGSPKRLYKAPTDTYKAPTDYTKPHKDYAKPQNIRQISKILNKALKYLTRVATNVNFT